MQIDFATIFSATSHTLSKKKKKKKKKIIWFGSLIFNCLQKAFQYGYHLLRAVTVKNHFCYQFLSICRTK